MNRIRTMLVGLGGYGNGYVDVALDRAEAAGIEFIGAVDPNPAGCKRLTEVTERIGKVHGTLSEFYEERRADLTVISAPIALHAPYTVEALVGGSHVLCEKPVAGSIQDALSMREAELRSGRTVAIGYQWSIAPPIERLVREVAAGTFGEPLAMKTVVLGPRSQSYYARNDWAGRLGKPGNWILDSPVNNAAAHYLHNMFFVLKSLDASPLSVQAELYRANEIESFDTCALRVQTRCGTEILFYASHAVTEWTGPGFQYDFRRARISCEYPAPVEAVFSDGREENYGVVEGEHFEKIQRTVHDIQRGLPPACSIVDALPHLSVVCGAHEGAQIVDFPKRLIRETAGTDRTVYVEGLEETLRACYAKGVLPSEVEDVTWAKAGRPFPLTGYSMFRGPAGQSS